MIVIVIVIMIELHLMMMVVVVVMMMMMSLFVPHSNQLFFPFLSFSLGVPSIECVKIESQPPLSLDKSCFKFPPFFLSPKSFEELTIIWKTL